MANLRAVSPDEKPPRPPRKRAAKTLKQAVSSSERQLLVTMRAKIATEIDSGVPPHTLAPLTRQLRDLDKEIRLLDARAREERREARVVADVEFDSSAI